MRYAFIGIWMFICSLSSAFAQVSIGINVSLSPEMVRVPGYPVYYAPRLDSNFFFYDGMYWVYQDDEWYASAWYNGPWSHVAPQIVPLFILRVPVSYYRKPPHYFRHWHASAPPRWGDRWGREWQQRRSAWDHWQRKAAPAPAPLPVYQRHYAGEQYPGINQQRDEHRRSNHGQPRQAATRAHVQERESRSHQGRQTAEARRQRAPEVQVQRQDRGQGGASQVHASGRSAAPDIDRRGRPEHARKYDQKHAQKHDKKHDQKHDRGHGR